MTNRNFEIVRYALALHLDIAPDAIELTDRLDDDLGLDPLDLVLIVLRLEELAVAEFPVADLEGTTTVADLVGVVAAWANDAHRPSSIHDAQALHVAWAW